MNQPFHFLRLAGILALSFSMITLTGCAEISNSNASSTGTSGTSGSGTSSTPSTPGTQFTQQATRAYDFSDSVGVNTHFGYTNTAYYLQPTAIISAIQALHVRHVRDGLAYGYVAPNLYSIFKQLAAAGIHPDLIMPNPSNGGPTAAAIEALLPNYPGTDSIENPNEYDNRGDANWATELRAYMPTVWQVGQTTGISVLGPSLTQTASYSTLGDVAPYMNFSNLHAYWGGRNPETTGWGGPDPQWHYYGSLSYDFDYLNIDSPGAPVVMTESGYVVNNTPSQNVIPESVEAVYEPRLLLHAWNRGIKRTYVYELMDEPSSTTGFGLMRSDLSTRPAYTAIATLLNLIADPETNFAPESLSYSMTGTTSGIESTLLQKEDGSFYLALWLPGSIFDVNAVASTPVTPQAVTIYAPGGKLVTNVWSFDNTGNASDISPSAASANLSVGSTVTLVEIR